VTPGPDPRPRCATVSRDLHVDPIGTAGHYGTFVLVEQPLPWPSRVEEVPLLADVASRVSSVFPESRTRVQAITSDRRDGAERLVVVYRRPPGPFTSFVRREGSAPAEDVPELVSELSDSLRRRPAGEEDGGPVDLLICTHGARDRCCGSLGMRLWTATATEAGPSVRRWRTSHTGGHRFAPTALVLPQGQYWAYLDERSLRTIIDQSGDPAELAGQYRGSAACGSGAEQAAEREAFVRHGWEWLGWSRSTEDLGGGRVHVHFERPGGDSGTYEVDTEVARSVPVPNCGEPVETWKGEEPELRVTGFRQI
jgi:hypothetical protein